jgi:hypothetical protein
MSSSDDFRSLRSNPFAPQSTKALYKNYKSTDTFSVEGNPYGWEPTALSIEQLRCFLYKAESPSQPALFAFDKFDSAKQRMGSVIITSALDPVVSEQRNNEWTQSTFVILTRSHFNFHHPPPFFNKFFYPNKYIVLHDVFKKCDLNK